MMSEPVCGDRAGIKRTFTPDARSERAVCEYRNHCGDQAAGYPRHIAESTLTLHHPAFPLPAPIDQRAGPSVRPPSRHTSFMTRPASGNKEEGHLGSDISNFADINLLDDLFACLQV
jgi:hypothetical protein